MAYSIQVGDILEVTFRGEYALQTTLTVLHFAVVTAPAAGDAFNQLTTLVTDIHASDLWIKYKNLIATNWTSDEIRVQVVSPQRRPLVSHLWKEAGTGLGTAQTANVSAVITKRTDIVTNRKAKLKRGGTGGVHVPCPATVMYDGGEIVDAYRTALNAWGVELLLGVLIGATGIARPCVWHRLTGAAIPYDIVTGTATQDTVRTMRRRTVGRGI